MGIGHAVEEEAGDLVAGVLVAADIEENGAGGQERRDGQQGPPRAALPGPAAKGANAP
jgi:hypothetical protein